MLNTGEVKCPTCGGTIEEHDCIDIETITNGVTMLKVGVCEYCGNEYQWNENFYYVGYTTPEKN